MHAICICFRPFTRATDSGQLQIYFSCRSIEVFVLLLYFRATDSETDAFCHTSLDNITITDKSCDSNDDSSLANYKYIFIIAQLLNGAGFAPLFTIAFIYLDENTHPNNTPLYIGKNI